MAMKKEMRGESIFDLWHKVQSAKCINEGQIGGQTSIFHTHFALGSYKYLNTLLNAYSDIKSLP